MKKQKRKLIRIISSLAIFLIVISTNFVLKGIESINLENGLSSIFGDRYGWLFTFGIFLAIYIFVGYDIVKKCFINISHGQVFDENFLMVVATFGAFGLGIYTGINEGVGEGFDEACAVLLFYQFGEWFQNYAVRKTRKSISELMNIRPEYANLVLENGEVMVVSPEEVKVNDIILVKVGERIPLDGEIIYGSSSLDTMALTGESMPTDVNVGSKVISGSINLTGVIKIKVKSIYRESTVAKILDLVQNENSTKANAEVFITKFSKFYTPIIVISAVLLAFVPPIIRLTLNQYGEFSIWIYRALNFLVVSCPCALVISVPLSLFVGLGSASKNGILIKGGVFLEQFNKANIFVFDKTGTLTKGEFTCTKFYPEDRKQELLELAYICELNSNHPLATAVRKDFNGNIKGGYCIQEMGGYGVVARSKDVIYCGNESLMKKYNIEIPSVDETGTILYIAKNDSFVGYIVVEDSIKQDAYYIVKYLNSIKAKVVMLTGDNEKVAKSVAQKLGIKEYKYSLLPIDKANIVDKLLGEKRENEKLCFIGDGINDAPVLTKADIGIAMGKVGSDVAIESSDVVIMRDDLRKIKTAKELSKHTMKIVYQNIFLALFIKIAILTLSSLGLVGLWVSVIGDVGVAFLAIMNSFRAGKRFKLKNR